MVQLLSKDATQTELLVEDWGELAYLEALARQEELVQAVLSGTGRERLVLVEHPATITLGRRATDADLHLPESFYRDQGICLQRINRGGLATAHEPGQLVVYPIVRLKKKDLRWFAHMFLSAVIQLLADYGIDGYLKEGEPGVWVAGRKICSFGIALKRWVSSHGIAVNINNSLRTFDMIVPCGQPGEIVTSLSRELGHQVDLTTAKHQFVEHFCKRFDYRPIT